MAGITVIDLYSLWRHYWCWYQWQTERELADLATATRIRYDWDGYDLIVRHMDRIAEPFIDVLDPEPSSYCDRPRGQAQ